jgi:hypothetical protein
MSPNFVVITKLIATIGQMVDAWVDGRKAGQIV